MRISREYSENSKEVEHLLHVTQLSLHSIGIPHRTNKNPTTPAKQSLNNRLSISLKFFCKSSDANGAQKNRCMVTSVGEALEKSIRNPIKALNTITEEIQTITRERSQSVINEINAINAKPHDLSVLKLQRVKKFIQFYNFFYSPESVLDANIFNYMEVFKPKCIEVKGNSVRLINRFYKENENNLKQFRDIANIFKMFTYGHLMYRYVRDKKLFHTLHISAAEINLLQINKFVKIHIQNLQFFEHDLLQLEHRLANKLLEDYEAYVKHCELKLCIKLNVINTESEIINNLLKREKLDNEQERDKETHKQKQEALAEHLQKVRQQQNKLCKTEAESKRLLLKILQRWLWLKRLREEQGFQYTRINLHIRTNIQAGVAKFKHAWQRPYANYLNDMTQKRFEYYGGKHNGKRPTEDSKVKHMIRSINQQFITSFSHPDKPNIDISFIFLNDEDFYKLCLPASWDKNRTQYSYFMKIFIDEQFVSTTETHRLEPDLRLNINESIGVLFKSTLPRNIKIAVYEKPKLLKPPNKIANIIVPLPIGCADRGFLAESIRFSSHKQKSSGRLQLYFTCEETIHPDGIVKILFPTPPQKSGLFKENNNHWRRKNVLKDKLVVFVIEYENKHNIERSNFQTCTFRDNLLRFCSINEFEKNDKRFSLLRTRFDMKDSNIKSTLFVPALNSELVHNKRNDELFIFIGNWMDPIDVQKHQGKKYLHNIYEALTNQCHRLSKQIENLENIIKDNPPPTIRKVIKAISNRFISKGSLNPVASMNISDVQPSHSFKGLSKYLCLDNFTIVMNVTRATGIPVRDFALVNSNGNGNLVNEFLSHEDFKCSNVRPFIALSYQDQFCRTMTADGSSPTWNEDLQLYLNGNLRTLKDDIKILLFDEVVEHYINDDIAVNDMNTYQTIQTNWMGEYRIPISSLLRLKKIEGVFELNMPEVLLGYKLPSFNGIKPSANNICIAIEHLPEVKRCTRLWFHISLEPDLSLPHLAVSHLECSELREVRHQLEDWCMNGKKMMPKRFFNPLICTEDGKLVCITRLLEPMPLPTSCITSNMLDTISRYTSFFNVIEGFDPAATDFDGIWLKNEVILNTTWASAKDLGILLANFMLSLGVSCQVVLCTSHPHGQCTFVLYYSSEQKSLMLIDPCSGRKYCAKDPFNPITKVHGIVTRDNIYLNIQAETRISMTNFNINDADCWMPAFNKRNPAPLGGLQNLNYTFVQSLPIDQLCKNIERKIIKKISSWRTLRKTIWNRTLQKRLLYSLIALEKKASSCSHSDSKHQELQDAKNLARDFPNYKFFGFTLNFSYTNISSISERVKSTGIHLNFNKDVQFSLAVHIHPYPNTVLSVWVYILSLIPNANI